MAISIRTAREIDAIGRAGCVLDSALDAAVAECRPGTATDAPDRAVRGVLREAGAEALLLGFPNPDGGSAFSAALSVCINETVTHGFGVPERRFQDGDLVTLDLAIRLEGWCADAARCVAVGEGGEPGQPAGRVVRALDEALSVAISGLRPGRRWLDTAEAVGRSLNRYGLSVLEGYSGHGIGRELHEAPTAGYRDPGRAGGGKSPPDFVLRPGMVLTIEPIACVGSPSLAVGADGWSVITRDGQPGGYAEWTVAVTRDGPRVLAGAGREATEYGGGGCL